MKMIRYLFFTWMMLVVLINTSISQNTNLSNAISFNGEPFLMVNPGNHQHIVVAWMSFQLNNNLVMKIRTSFDAGVTWTTPVTIPHVVAGYTSADPSMAFDSNGNLFLCYIDYNATTFQGGVYIVKSTDGGITWGTPIEVINANADGNQYPIDRPWMVIDQSGGIYDGNIYITTMPPSFVTPPNRAYFVKSTDGGNSFSTWNYLDGAGALIGNFINSPMPTPTINNNGILQIAYPSYVVSQNVYPQFILATSSDGGTSFSYQPMFNVTSSNNDTLPKKGYTLISNPSNANHLVFAFPGNDHGDLDIFISETFDGGSTWSLPIRVNDDPIGNKRMQDLVWADFDTDGDLVLAWRDRRNSNDTTYTTSSEIYAAVRWNGHPNFSTNFSLTDSSISYHTILAQKGNDFMGVNIINDTLYAAWGDPRNGFLNIWFQRVDLQNGGVFIRELENETGAFKIYPNPTKHAISLDFLTLDLDGAVLSIYNHLGQLIFQRSQLNLLKNIDVSSFEKGTYTIKISNKNGNYIQKLVVN